MEQQRNKIEDRKKQLQKHLEDNCRDLAVKIHGEEPGNIKLIPPTATDALTIFVEMNGFILQSDTGGRRGTSNWNELGDQIVGFSRKMACISRNTVSRSLSVRRSRRPSLEVAGAVLFQSTSSSFAPSFDSAGFLILAERGPFGAKALSAAWRGIFAEMSRPNRVDVRARVVLRAPVLSVTPALELSRLDVRTGSSLIRRMVSVIIETPRWARQNAHRNDPSLNPS